MTPRWMVERKATNRECDDLIVIEVFAVGENKELVKKENRRFSHQRKLLLIEGDRD